MMIMKSRYGEHRGTIPLTFVIPDTNTGHRRLYLSKRNSNSSRNTPDIFFIVETEAFYAGRANKERGANGSGKRKDPEWYAMRQNDFIQFILFPSDALIHWWRPYPVKAATVDMRYHQTCGYCVAFYLAVGMSNKEIASSNFFIEEDLYQRGAQGAKSYCRNWTL